MTTEWSTYYIRLILAPIILGQKCKITSPDIEGPFYKRDAPLTNTTVCQSKNKNNTLIVQGRVTDISTNCKKGLQSLLDVWQANENALYSDGRESFECRAKIITDAQGYYRFTTVWPAHYEDGPYGFRPAHIHYKITPLYTAVASTLTTQMYFKNDTFLGINDPCHPFCKSGEPTLQTRPKLCEDGKTYCVTFNIVLKVNDDGDENNGSQYGNNIV